jgi:hypothetical protein
VLNPPLIDNLIKSGKVVGPRVDFARAGIGVAVKAGAPKLDLGTVDAFKRAMLNAKSIGYSTAGSGVLSGPEMGHTAGMAERRICAGDETDGARARPCCSGFWPRARRYVAPREPTRPSPSHRPVDGRRRH